MAFAIDSGSRVPIYQQLAQQIREGIARGQLAPEDRLPSIRQMSQDIVVNPNTVARTYTELEREGVVVSRPGLGVFVAQPRQELTKAARDRKVLDLLDRWLTEAVHLGFTADEVMRLVTHRVAKFQWNAAGTR
jgi:GntR family transcriptional regulator